jgi:hypothetical protein
LNLEDADTCNVSRRHKLLQCQRWSHVYNGQFKEAEDALEDVVSFCEKYGCENLGTPASIILGAALLGQGRMSQGLKLIKEAHQLY